MPTPPEPLRQTFSKAERLCGRKRIDALFSPAGRSMAAYPLRAVYMMGESAGNSGTLASSERGEAGVPAEIFISVPKRLLRHAVDRNRAKRLVREAYRRNKGILWTALAGRHIGLAFLWISPRLADYKTVEQKLVNLLQRISEEI